MEQKNTSSIEMVTSKLNNLEEDMWYLTRNGEYNPQTNTFNLAAHTNHAHFTLVAYADKDILEITFRYAGEDQLKKVDSKNSFEEILRELSHIHASYRFSEEVLRKLGYTFFMASLKECIKDETSYQYLLDQKMEEINKAFPKETALFKLAFADALIANNSLEEGLNRIKDLNLNSSNAEIRTHIWSQIKKNLNEADMLISNYQALCKSNNQTAKDFARDSLTKSKHCYVEQKMYLIDLFEKFELESTDEDWNFFDLVIKEIDQALLNPLEKPLSYSTFNTKTGMWAKNISEKESPIEEVELQVGVTPCN